MLSEMCKFLALKSTPKVGMTSLLNFFFVNWWIRDVFPTPASPITITWTQVLMCCSDGEVYLECVGHATDLLIIFPRVDRVNVVLSVFFPLG